MTTSPLKPSVRTSGGNPNGFPDFRPINKLPEHEIRALARRLIKPAMYQVSVLDVKRRQRILVGPRCRSDTALAFAYEISKQVKLGTERDWADPYVNPVL